MRFAGLASLLIIGVVVAAGCDGDGGAQTPTSQPASDATAPSPFSLTFEEFDSDGLGYRVEIPEGWAHEEVEGEVEGVTFLTESFNATAPIDGELPTMTVLKTLAGDRMAEELLTAESAAAIQEDDLVIAGHDAVRVDITDSGLDFTQVLVVIDDTAWTLTFVVEAGNRDKFLPIFERAYSSFQPK